MPKEYPLKVDYYLPPGPLREVAPAAAWAKGVGYDGIFTADAGHEPFLPIVQAVSVAPGLDYGTAIAVAFARSPMVVAQTAWDLAAFTEGRFLLGLGTQIKPHIERRFSMPWDSPGPKMREFIEAIRVIWNTWQSGEPLRFKGDHYSFTLMTPFFNPGPIRHPAVPVYIAGVGPYMSRLAGEICDGYHVHPFHSVKYLEEVTFPAMDEGTTHAGRARSDVDLVSTIFVVTGSRRFGDAGDAQWSEAADRLLCVDTCVPGHARDPRLGSRSGADCDVQTRGVGSDGAGDPRRDRSRGCRRSTDR